MLPRDAISGALFRGPLIGGQSVFFVTDRDKVSIADSNYQWMERRVKLCRLAEIVGRITVITPGGHGVLSFLSGCLILFPPFSLPFFPTAGPLSRGKLIRVGKWHTLRQMDGSLFLKVFEMLPDWCTHVSCNCFAVRLCLPSQCD